MIEKEAEQQQAQEVKTKGTKGKVSYLFRVPVYQTLTIHVQKRGIDELKAEETTAKSSRASSPGSATPAASATTGKRPNKRKKT